MLDLHIIHCIKNGLKYYLDNSIAFKQLFNDIGGALQNTYYSRYVEIYNTIQTDAAFSRLTEKFPLISIALSEAEIDETTFLGNFGHPGNSTLTELNNQECRIAIYAAEMIDIRILHRLVRCILLLFKKSFLDIGYTDIRYIQSKDQRPLEAPTSKGGIIYNRELLYTAQSQLVVKRLDNTFDVLPWVLSPSTYEPGAIIG